MPAPSLWPMSPHTTNCLSCPCHTMNINTRPVCCSSFFPSIPQTALLLTHSCVTTHHDSGIVTVMHTPTPYVQAIGITTTMITTDVQDNVNIPPQGWTHGIASNPIHGIHPLFCPAKMFLSCPPFALPWHLAPDTGSIPFFSSGFDAHQKSICLNN